MTDTSTDPPVAPVVTPPTVDDLLAQALADFPGVKLAHAASAAAQADLAAAQTAAATAITAAQATVTDATAVLATAQASLGVAQATADATIAAKKATAASAHQLIIDAASKVEADIDAAVKAD